MVSPLSARFALSPLNALLTLFALLVPRIFVALGLGLALALAGAGPAAAATWWVEAPPLGDDANDCASAATPCATIAAALDLAVSGDDVLVGPGLFDENLNVPAGVSVFGAGAPLTLVTGGRRDRVFRLGDFATLGDLTVTEGLSAEGGGGVDGGRCVLLIDLVVDDNESLGDGLGAGGVRLGRDGRIERCRVSDNRAGTALIGPLAGGVLATFSLHVVDSLVSDNLVGDGNELDRAAGGLLVFGGSARLSCQGSQILGNRAGDGAAGGFSVSGGAAHADLSGTFVAFNEAADAIAFDASVGGGLVEGGSAVLCEGDFEENIAGASSDDAASVGGALVQGGSAEVFRVLVVGNVAGDDGIGGLGLHGGGARGVDCQALGNRTGDRGAGGIDVAGAGASLIRSTASDNEALTEGVGGLRLTGASAWAENVTVSGNRAGTDGVGGALLPRGEGLTVADNVAGTGGIGGVAPDFASAGTVLGHSLLGGNTGGLADDCLGISSDGFNLVEDPACFGLSAAGDLSGLAPLLGPLADHGGPTLTRAPLPGSPALDGGDSFGLFLDQRGLDRPQGAALDIGAHETCMGGPCLLQAPEACPEPLGLPDDCGRVEPCADDTQPPMLVGVPADTVADCDEIPGLPVVTALDDCDPAPELSLAELLIDGPCEDSYDLLRTFTAVDSSGNSASASQLIEVRDETPPVLLGVPADETVDCGDEPAPAPVTAIDDCDPAPSVSFEEVLVEGDCPGEHRLVRTWTAEDRCGNSVSASQVVSVVDTTPPSVVESRAVAACLWPPDHRMVCFDREDFAPQVEDDCGEPVSWFFSGCASNQPDDARGPEENGDGHTTGDCEVAEDGSSFCVRAERAGSGPLAEQGRRYAVTIVAVDACGNMSESVQIGAILVPHDRRDLAGTECRSPGRGGPRR